MSDRVPSPEEFFGFQLGSDRKIARWDQIVGYFHRLAQESECIRVIDLGPSTEGHPFLLVIISAPENLDRLEELKAINAQLSDPRDVSDVTIPTLVASGRAVICQSMSLHATEISGTQMAPELAYDLVTGSDPATRAILDEVIFLMIPCSNPDGQIMVSDWYEQHLGTEYEGCRLPWLYHRYAGHDNNRDAFMTQLVESRAIARILFQEWRPQAYQDLHEMGSYTARFYVAPYSEPIHPHADPLVWREINWYGAHMAYKLEEAGKAGVLNAAYFAGWCHLGFHWIGLYHNLASMLTEGAPAKLATPLFVHRSQLSGEGSGTVRAFPQYKAQTNFPNPWEGGWWRLRDLVEYQKTAARALLEMAARHRETILQNAVRKARQQTARGASGQPAAFVIPAHQHDPLTAQKLVRKLFEQGIELRRATEAFTDGEVSYPAGSTLIPLAQPKMGLIRTLLERTRYPDDAWTRLPDGSPARPYDTATDTFAEFMGCDVRPLLGTSPRKVETIREPETPVGVRSGPSTVGYLFDGRLNDSFAAVNAFLRQGIAVRRFDDAVAWNETAFPPGTFLVAAGCEDAIDAVARETGVPFHALAEEPHAPRHVVKPQRIGIYQRYWGGNMDEGWTRLVLEQFGFPYTTLQDEAIKKGELNASFDVILFPHDSLIAITGNEERFQDETVPPDYRSGIGDEGVAAIKAFVAGGGALVLLNQACDLAFEKLGLKATAAPRIENLLKDVPTREFFCPGSTLRARVDTHHPLGYGMPAEALLLGWDSPAFRIKPSPFNERCEVVVEYPKSEILQSGWLIGEERIAGHPAMVSVGLGKGRVILYGFRPQHRAQTHGTYKLLFNALLGRQSTP
jgi:hypothetical protein